MRLTIRDIQKMKDDGQRIPVITAYDAPSARLSEAAGIPILLVGDSLGMVVQGHQSPIPVKLEHMMYHSEIVSRVTEKPLIVCDLPFLTYTSPEMALANAGKLIQDGGATAVKLEGGVQFAPTIRHIVDAGIPVMAHIGLTPQSIHQFGGFRVQGKDLEPARQLLRDAEAVQAAGAFAVVLELVPTKLATLITERLRIPTIGIGAGYGCAGQVQVFHDIVTLFSEFLPKHARRYINAGELIQQAITKYRTDVIEGEFPKDENSFNMSDSVIDTLRSES